MSSPTITRALALSVGALKPIGHHQFQRAVYDAVVNRDTAALDQAERFVLHAGQHGQGMFLARLERIRAAKQTVERIKSRQP